MNDKELIDRAAELNLQKAEIEKELDKIKTAIKAIGVGTYNGDRFKAVVTNRVSKTLNQEKALAVTKKLGAKWLIKEVVDEKKLEESLAAGEIDANEFAGCIDTKTTTYTYEYGWRHKRVYHNNILVEESEDASSDEGSDDH